MASDGAGAPPTDDALQAVRDFAAAYSGGVHRHGHSVVSSVLQQYLLVEQHFAAGANFQDAALGLREVHKEDLALAVGAPKFAPYRDASLRAAAANLELDSTELAEHRDPSGRLARRS